MSQDVLDDSPNPIDVVGIRINRCQNLTNGWETSCGGWFQKRLFTLLLIILRCMEPLFLISE